jgi:hypothetical protein
VSTFIYIYILEFSRFLNILKYTTNPSVLPLPEVMPVRVTMPSFHQLSTKHQTGGQFITLTNGNKAWL